MNDYPMDSTAAGFMETLKKMGDDLKADMETIVNNVVERTFESILDQSPYDKGRYVASHRISKGSERTDSFTGDFGTPRKSEASRQAGIAYSKQEAEGFRWDLADDSVWFSNHVDPHHQWVETGWPHLVSKKTTTKEGYLVYHLAEQRMEKEYIPKEVKKAGY